MLSRTTSSRRRRASRANISGSGAANNRGTLPARSSAAAAAAAAARSTATRRASVAVGASDTRSSSTPTPPPDDDVPHNRSPRGSLGGEPSPRTSPRNSLTPEGPTRTSPRNSLIPETTRTSPRNSLVPENFNRSPRNSLVPDVTRTSPRNSLVPENYNRSPRNSLVPENFNRSPRNSLVPDMGRSPRNSLVPDAYNRSPRNSLVPDTSRSSRNSLVPDSNRSPRNSLVPDSSRSPRNSLVPDSNRSPRNSLVPDPNRSPRGSLIPDPGRSPRGSLIPDNFNRSPRNSLVPETYVNRSPRGSLVAEGINRSPRGSISSTAGGIVGAAFERGAGFAETAQPGLLSDRNPDAPSESDSAMAGSSRGGVRSQSPYRMSVSARGAQINLGYSGGSTWENAESRRASSNVSQVSADDRRHLCERTKLSSEVGLGLTAYGSFVYQLKDANMEASGTCDFVCRAMRIVYKTVVITVALVCLMSLPLLMLIMGVQYLRDCPVEPHIPVYMVVGGSFGTLKMAWLLWRQVRSRRYERLDLTTPLQEIDAGMSAGTRVISAALTVFLIVWFVLGNYWILHIAWPDYELKLYDPNRWCHKTLYIFAVVHLAILYGIMVLLVLCALSLSLCQLLACPFFIRYK